MGQVLHGSATTTEAVRRAIQRSQESLRRWPNATESTPRPSRVEAADLGDRPADWTEKVEILGAVGRR
jgi:hypothetical protein